MKQLYLIRHAKSSWEHNDLHDHDRPLNKRGLQDAPEMGNRLKSLGITPSALITSTANRALSTAKAIAAQIKYPSEEIILDSNLYHSSEDEILEIVHQIDNKYDSAMLFGHNPGFTWFANELGSLNIDNIPTCGIVGFNLDAKSWQEINWGNGKLLFFDYPKNKH